MYKKILLAADGSENARRAAKEAIGLSKELSSNIVIVYIFHNPPSQPKLTRAHFDVHSILEEEAKYAVSETIMLLESEKVAYTLKVAIGEPAGEIIGIAEEENVDLLILGSRGLGTIKGAVIGSVSQKVAHLAKCPVMIVK